MTEPTPENEQQTFSTADRLAQIDALPVVRTPMTRFILALVLVTITTNFMVNLDFLLFPQDRPSRLVYIFTDIGYLAFAGTFGLWAIRQYELQSFLGWYRPPAAWQITGLFVGFMAFTLYAQWGFSALLGPLGEAPGLLLISFLGDLAIGFHEEVWFRGLLLTSLVLAWRQSRRGHVAAILVSSAAFGAWHLLGLVYGADPTVVVSQAFYASALGVMFAVLFLASGSIWPPLLAHGIFDFGISYYEAAAYFGDGESFFQAGGTFADVPKALLQDLPFIAISSFVAFAMLRAYLKHPNAPLPISAESAT